MGSPGRKRGRRTRSDDGGDRIDFGDGLAVPSYEHNEWTIEGEIERFGEFARGSSRARGWKRAVAVVVALAMLLPIGIALIAAVVHLAGG